LFLFLLGGAESVTNILFYLAVLSVPTYSARYTNHHRNVGEEHQHWRKEHPTLAKMTYFERKIQSSVKSPKSFFLL
jgi:hypothetical protein